MGAGKLGSTEEMNDVSRIAEVEMNDICCMTGEPEVLSWPEHEEKRGIVAIRSSGGVKIIAEGKPDWNTT